MFETVLRLQERTDPPKDKKQKYIKIYIKKISRHNNLQRKQ